VEVTARPRWKRRWVWVYLGLLIASNIVQGVLPEEWFRLPSAAPQHVEVDAKTSAGDTQHIRLGYLEWWPAVEPKSHSPEPVAKPPVILIHGSPGQANDYAKMGPLLAHSGYRVLAFDMPGFNESSGWVKDYSILANAHGVLAAMDALHIDRAHVVGWSNGGGVGLHMADQAPQRTASLTMLASIGTQENEGSGSFAFEHFKYAVAYGAAVVLPECVPHFGLLGPRKLRHGFARNFWDSDQRPLRALMQRLTVPTLILHGRHDVLIAARAAEDHHRLIPTSRLVMLDANHFLPFTHAQATADHLLPFFERHDQPGVSALSDVLDLAPSDHAAENNTLAQLRTQLRSRPWWLQMVMIAWMVAILPLAGLIAAVCFAVAMDVDMMVALVGVIVGLALHAIAVLSLALLAPDRLHRLPFLKNRLSGVSAIDWRRRLSRGAIAQGFNSAFIPSRCTPALLGVALARPGVLSIARFITGRLLGAITWAASAFFFALIAVSLIAAWSDSLGPIWSAALLIPVALLAQAFPMLLTGRSRRHLAARLSRAIHYEYWPAFLFYLPLAPYITWLSIKHRGVMVVTCCNPAIENGGGLVGESKSTIMTALGDNPFTLRTVLIPGGMPAAQRARLVSDAMRREPALATFPIIIKPDAGQRGFGVKLARSDEDVVEYFESMTSPALIQPFHPGPHECSILWVRRPQAVGALPANGSHAGFLYSITSKEFPVLTGDGLHTLEDLIYRHPRFRRQAHVFLNRHAHRAAWSPARGEQVHLAVAGNHCQGTLFRDGSDLVTPQLTATVDRLARAYRNGDPQGDEGLDYARFDVRFESVAGFTSGTEFSIVELNGTTGESTNLYDPAKSLLWAYKVLFGQWRILFELGAARRAAGTRPMTMAGVVGVIRAHYQQRRGSELSD